MADVMTKDVIDAALAGVDATPAPITMPVNVPRAPMTEYTKPAPRTTVQTNAAERASEATLMQAYRHSEQFGKLMVALAAAQSEFGDIEKALTATVTPRDASKRSYTYRYCDLDTVLKAIRPALSKYGIALVQVPTPKRGGMLVTTMLAHGESEQWFAGDIIVALDTLDPQAVGSAVTYARRIGLCALVGVAAGEKDDDGVAAGVPAAAPAAEPEGYAAWALNMEDAADEGTATLETAWRAAKLEYRKHIPAATKDALKARAKAADAARKGAK